MATYARHALGRKMEPSWNSELEIGIRFWRHQFTSAMSHRDPARGRQIFDSLQTETNDSYAVDVKEDGKIKGHWHIPKAQTSKATLLYLHGGGYTYHGAVSVRFASMLAHRVGARLFAPDYRLTPEHPHPAQAEDALAAWKHIAATTTPDRIVVIGDSAGGHMALSLLQTLKAHGLPQPALCVGLCPWTDIGARGNSLTTNNKYDHVQGWMALRFGEWLDPKRVFGRAALSPVNQNYAGLAPLYLQAGGREVLRDMIVEFADIQTVNGADITLDVWQDMPHVFQAYDSWKRSSREAIARICQVIDARVESPSLGDAIPAPTRAIKTLQQTTEWRRCEDELKT